MISRAYTIGQASRRSGVPVRRIRFYCDEGLLSRIDRSDSGYRMFDEGDLSLLVMIQTLREAGLSLDSIRSVLSRKSSMNDVLAIRLHEIEASIVAQKRIAATIRVALQSLNPTAEDLRRIWLVSNTSKTEYISSIRNFLNKVAEGSKANPSWTESMLRSSTLSLPDEPDVDQIDAWLELSELISDPSFIEKARRYAEDRREHSQPDLLSEMLLTIVPKAKAAQEQQIDPSSSEAKNIADEYINIWAKAYGVEIDDNEIQRQFRSQAEHRYAMRPYWKLVSRLNGMSNLNNLKPEWQWLMDAYESRLTELSKNQRAHVI
ncbi:MerR family transcriptional regulator [Brucellaceae bacterium C25G]